MVATLACGSLRSRKSSPAAEATAAPPRRATPAGRTPLAARNGAITSAPEMLVRPGRDRSITVKTTSIAAPTANHPSSLAQIDLLGLVRHILAQRLV